MICYNLDLIVLKSGAPLKVTSLHHFGLSNTSTFLKNSASKL